MQFSELFLNWLLQHSPASYFILFALINGQYPSCLTWEKEENLTVVLKCPRLCKEKTMPWVKEFQQVYQDYSVFKNGNASPDRQTFLGAIKKASLIDLSTENSNHDEKHFSFNHQFKVKYLQISVEPMDCYPNDYDPSEDLLIATQNCDVDAVASQMNLEEEMTNSCHLELNDIGFPSFNEDFGEESFYPATGEDGGRRPGSLHTPQPYLPESETSIRLSPFCFSSGQNTSINPDASSPAAIPVSAVQKGSPQITTVYSAEKEGDSFKILGSASVDNVERLPTSTYKMLILENAFTK